MKFRLGTIAYVFALLAAGMAAFGAVGGALSAAWVAGVWIMLHAKPARAVGVLATSLLACVVGLTLVSAMGDARMATSRQRCAHNLKWICLALHNYETANGAFPPAYVADADGKPMHSWRVLILPYAEEPALYKKYRFDEPWDGPNNRQLWDQMPSFYACPGCEQCRRLKAKPFGEMPRYATSYVAVVGEETAWPAGRQRKWSDFLPAGPSKTLQVMECSGMTTPWTAPVDLTYAEALAELTAAEAKGHINVTEDFFTTTFSQHARLAAFGDGSSVYLRGGSTEADARRMLTIAGGDKVDDDAGEWTGADAKSRIVTVVHYDRVYALLAFVGVALWPGVRMWRRA